MNAVQEQTPARQLSPLTLFKVCSNSSENRTVAVQRVLPGVTIVHEII